MAAIPLSSERSILVISDRLEHADRAARPWTARDMPWQRTLPVPQRPIVAGGYLERLPLACIAAGIVDQAEIWHHVQGAGASLDRESHWLQYRGLPVDNRQAPFQTQAMMSLLHASGAPHILLVLGLGVDAALLDACANSIRIYNSIDAPALRVPEEVSANFDIILTGAQWQSDAVKARHPDMKTAILPVGPEFAGFEQFRPLGLLKDYDLIYVAAAQEYKRHDILFSALEQCPREVRTLCVFGYGEMAQALRMEAGDRGLCVDFIGPPGVGLPEVNRLMNRAKFGVVCGEYDGAPAILTEYMLAGLPVLANADLVCGQQYILPETGMLARPDQFGAAILEMRERYTSFTPRDIAVSRWTWPHTIAKLRPLIEAARSMKPQK